jgi:hypothetical protein
MARLMPVHAQEDADSIPWYGHLAVGIGHDDVRNVDVGLMSLVPSVKGFQLSLIGGGVDKSMSGLGVYGILGAVHENTNGVQIAGISLVKQNLNGLSVAGVSYVGERLHGVQIGGINVAPEMKGVQLGFLNGGCNSGLQIGAANVTANNAGACVGGLNIEFEHCRGLQLGCENFADSLSGVQIGIFNICGSNSKGVQVGIVNYCGEEGRQFGLVNLNPHTRYQMLVATGNHDPFSLALRIRNRHTYNVIGFGFGLKGCDEYRYGSVYYRVGQYIALLPRLILSGDIGIAEESVLRRGIDVPSLLSLEARMNLEYEVHSRVSLFATAGYASTHYVSDGDLFRRKPLFEWGVALF